MDSGGIEEGAVVQSFDPDVDRCDQHARERGRSRFGSAWTALVPPAGREGAAAPPPGRAARRRAMRDRAVIPLLVISLSAIVPGAGQLYLRRWRRGLLMLGVTLVVLFAAAMEWRRGTGGIIEALVRPRVLLGFLIGNVLLGVFRVAAAADAWWLARRRTAWVVRWHRDAGRPFPRAGRLAAATPVLALVAGVLVAPHAVAGYAGATAYAVLTSVFGGRGTPGPDRQAAAAPVPGPGVPQPPGPVGRLTVLLLGGDAGPGRSGLRTDTMIVVTADPSSGRVAVIALPRNLRGVPLRGMAARAFPDGRFPGTLNALYPFAAEHPELFPGSGGPAAAVRSAVEDLLGLPIQRYALVDLAGFVDVIDALGGVDVRVAERVTDRLSPVRPGGGKVAADLLPGLRHLDGEAALVYVRSRWTTNDYDRMRRQRCLLSALAEQADLGELLRGLPRLAEVAKRSVHTDIAPDELPRLARLAAGINRGEVRSIAIVPPYYAPRDERGYPTVRLDRVRRAVHRVTQPAGSGADPAGVWDGGESLATSCS
jgi:LCP family protein required for cell wall assembly